MKIFSRLLIILISVLFIATILPSCQRSYEDIKQLLLYDRIVCDGTDYYFMDNAPELKTLEDEKTLVREENVQVMIADENSNPYDPNITEEAWTFIGKDGRIYIYFNSRYFTSDKSMASEYYGFKTP